MNIDSEIFKFIDKLMARVLASQPEPASVKTMKGMEPIIDLGEIQDLQITHFDEDDGSTKTKFASVGDKMVGLSLNDFDEFKSLILELLNDENFGSKCTTDFLIDHSFDWLISVYKNKKADTSLTNYLLDCVEKESATYFFYFKIEALAIEKKIQIGDTEIMFFSDNEIEKNYSEFIIAKPNTAIEEFRNIYKGFSKINAHVKVKGVFDRAEEIAKNKVELAVDILKIYCIPYCTDSKIQMFDLDYRIKRGSAGIFINMPEGKIRNSSIQIRNHSGVVPIQLDSGTIDRFLEKGLPVFSEFIMTKKDNELYYAITDAIRQLSEITSTENNYEKIIKAISLSESILLPRPAVSKAKGLTRIKKAIPKIIPGNVDRAVILNSIGSFYNIRDSYLHNNIRKPFSKEALFFFLDFQRVLILKLIELNQSITTLQKVHDHFGIT